MLENLRKRLNRQTKRPFQLFQIESSMHCNLNCIMCPWISVHGEVKLLSPDTFNKIQPYLSLATEVDLTGGGEPLINPNLLEMVRAAKEAGCQVGFSTNGTLLSRKLAQTLIEYELDWISFSVDAATPETYHQIRQGADFGNVIGNIQALNQLKPLAGRAAPKTMLVFVVMVGTPENYREMPAYLDLAHSLGVEQVIFKNLDVITKDGDYERGVFAQSDAQKREVEAIREQASQKAARLGIGLRLYNLQPRQQVICEQNPVRNLYINWAGEVSPCITLSYADSRIFNGERVSVPCQIYGNVNQEPLDAIWNKDDYAAFRQVYEDRMRLEQEAMMQSMLGGDGDVTLPPAPEGCQTCYYLYGV